MTADTAPVDSGARDANELLSLFGKKLEDFRREMEKLRRAAVSGKSFDGKWPTEGLDKIAKSLLEIGQTNEMPEVVEWAKRFSVRIDAIRDGASPPSDADLEWLAAQLRLFEMLHTARSSRSADSTLRMSLEPRAPRSSTPGSAAAPSASSSPAPPASSPPRAPHRQSSVPPGGIASSSAPPAPPARSRGADSAPARPVARATISSLPGGITDQARRRPHVYVAISAEAAANAVSAMLTRAGFETRVIAQAEALHDAVIEEAPEVVIVDIEDAAPGGLAMAEALASDPLTSFVPVLKLGRTSDRARRDELPKPLEPERLLSAVRRIASAENHTARIATGMGEPTLGGLLALVNEELRAGLVDSATAEAMSERIRIPSQGRLLGSMWELIAKMRHVATEGSRGKIRFTPPMAVQLGLMALSQTDDALGDGGSTEASEIDVAALKGLRAIVADDSAEVCAAYHWALTEVGMSVQQTASGRDLFDAIRRGTPDIIVADVLMPGMDIFDLCRRLRSDHAIRHVPLIALSWKQDFIERLKSFGIPANDFMLKETEAKHIVARVARVLHPRFVFSRQLALQGDVTGRIERLGVLAILEVAAQRRQDCRVSFRDAWSYFEADIRAGELIAVSRTFANGSFESGATALERLLCTTHGKFAVLEATDTPRRQFSEGTQQAVAAACGALNKIVAQIVSGSLFGIARATLDPDTLALYSKVVPPELRVALDRLSRGASPREIVASKEASADSLERLLLDLHDVGAIVRLEKAPRDSVEVLQRTSPVPFASDTPTVQANILPKSGAPLGAASPVAHEPLAKPSSPNVWKLLTFVLFAALIGCGFVAYRAMTSTEAQRPADPPALPTSPSPQPSPQTPEPTNTPAQALEALPSESPPPAAETVESAAPQPTAEPPIPSAAPAGNAKRTNAPASVVEISNEPARSEKVAAPKAAVPGKGSGKLSIALPPDSGGAIAVTIDGISRGNAPLLVPLSPGLHEVVFTSDAGRDLRMVSIKTGETKVIPAKVAP